MIWVKVCGLRQERDVEAAVEAGTDAVGFVLAKGSPRRVSIDRAVAAGLQCRPLADTISDTWQWLNSGAYQADNVRGAQYGMDPAREATIIARWRAMG